MDIKCLWFSFGTICAVASGSSTSMSSDTDVSDQARAYIELMFALEPPKRVENCSLWNRDIVKELRGQVQIATDAEIHLGHYVKPAGVQRSTKRISLI